MDPFLRLAGALESAGVRYVLIGVAGANQYARSVGSVFVTEAFDPFLPTNAGNAMLAWRVCAEAGLELWSGSEPLDRYEFLAEQVVARRALVRAEGRDLRADLTLVMAGFEFEDVWKEHRAFTIEGVSVPVAALHQIVQSKAHAGRPKDRLFLASHEDALRELMNRRP